MKPCDTTLALRHWHLKSSRLHVNSLMSPTSCSSTQDALERIMLGNTFYCQLYTLTRPMHCTRLCTIPFKYCLWPHFDNNFTFKVSTVTSFGDGQYWSIATSLVDDLRREWHPFHSLTRPHEYIPVRGKYGEACAYTKKARFLFGFSR